MDKKQMKWLKSKKGFMNVSAIEDDLKMPQSALNKYLLHDTKLAGHWFPKIEEWVKNFKKYG